MPPVVLHLAGRAPEYVTLLGVLFGPLCAALVNLLLSPFVYGMMRFARPSDRRNRFSYELRG